jgi:hypothetical protein
MNQTMNPVGGEQARSLYRQAGQLEMELWNVAQQDPFAEMTREQAHSFNAYLRQAREVVPAANALREAGEDTLVSEAHRALRGHLLPELEKIQP